MVDSFADAAPEGSQVNFVLSDLPEEHAFPSRSGSVRFSYMQADHPTCCKALQVSAANN
jgi:hypothetical protein